MNHRKKIIKIKLARLRLPAMLGNVSQAGKVIGYSRDSLDLFKELDDTAGEFALGRLDQSIGSRLQCFHALGRLFSASAVISLAWVTIDRTFCGFIPGIFFNPCSSAAATLAIVL